MPYTGTRAPYKNLSAGASGEISSPTFDFGIYSVELYRKLLKFGVLVGVIDGTCL